MLFSLILGLLTSLAFFFLSSVELDTAMKGLGKYWSTLLAQSDADLGIDREFTRPGVEALLGQFTHNISFVVEQGCAPFKWDRYKEKASTVPAAATGASAEPVKGTTAGKRKRTAK